MAVAIKALWFGESINEEDPRQMVGLMRRFSEKTGISLGDKMEEALSRLEAGEDPESVEQDMGDLLDRDEGFNLEDMKKRVTEEVWWPFICMHFALYLVSHISHHLSSPMTT